jgi:hypothetical protein
MSSFFMSALFFGCRFLFFDKCTEIYFLKFPQQAVFPGQMLPYPFFEIPSAGRFSWPNAPISIFCNSLSRPFFLDKCSQIHFLQFPRRPFSLDKCSQIHFLQFPPQAIFSGQMLPDSFFAIPSAGRFPWTNGPRFIFCNSLSRPFSLDKCSQIHFLQFPQQAVFPGQMDQDLFFAIPSAGRFPWTE